MLNATPYPADTVRMRLRSRLRFAALAAAAILLSATLASCGKKVVTKPTQQPPRSWRMGFSGIPPNNDFPTAIAALEMWRTRSDAAIMHISPAWDTLLAGYSADSVVMKVHVGLADYYKATGRTLVVMIDATNGLDRAKDAPELVARGRSLTEPAVQLAFRKFAQACDSLLRPAYLGLTAETNLIRAAAPAPLYAAVKQNANDAAAAIRAFDNSVQLFVSVQVEVAWGLPGGTYVGIATDLADFPFTQAMGLSSYPYFVFAEPEDVPLDYYSRVLQGTGLPGMVVEGGWTSATVGGITSSPAKQARYLRRHAQLLDQADAAFYFQLTFTDLDLNVFPAGAAPFAYLGMVGITLTPKPALATWDSAFARPRM